MVVSLEKISSQPSSHESKAESIASPEVTAAMKTIVDTEKYIDKSLGLEFGSSESIRETDEALVYVAEQAADSIPGNDDSINAVEIAVIAGALEASGLRILNNQNPITVLELDGYGASLTDVTAELHEHHATLPNGIEAAHVVAQELDRMHVEQGLSGGAVELESGQDIIERSANFQGNWTEAQTKRTGSPNFKRKLDAFINRGAADMKEVVDPFDRERVTKDEYLARSDDYQERHTEVTSAIGYMHSSEFRAHAPSTLGFAEYNNKKAVLLSDAENAHQPLTSRQKDIIAAHEMYHLLVNPRGDNIIEIRSAFNFGEIAESNAHARSIDLEKRTPGKYMRSPDELTARMAQVKNYYGMRSDEVFTHAHLDYARKHYVEDTGLDNSMTIFFKMINDERFVDLMNELPI